MAITVIGFPFDQHGSPGSRAGAALLVDAVREMRKDARRETKPRRSHAYRDDLKILEVPFDTPGQFKRWKERGAAAFAKHHDAFPVWLSGNHLGVLPVLESLGPDVLVVQFDAHLDIFELDEVDDRLSHGNFLLHAEKPLPKLINVGHRDLFLPQERIQKHYSETLPSPRWLDPAKPLAELQKTAKAAKKIWIDIDCDAFDPIHFPAVSEPEPMGLAPVQLVGVLDAIWSRKVVGISISEFLPQRDADDHCLATLCWLLEWVFLKVGE